MTNSPCTAVCTLDQNDVCLGCYRTAGKIMWWSQMSDEQRKSVIDRINDQMALPTTTPNKLIQRTGATKHD